MRLLIDGDYSDVGALSFLKCYIISQFLLFVIIMGFSILLTIIFMIVDGGLWKLSGETEILKPINLE